MASLPLKNKTGITLSSEMNKMLVPIDYYQQIYQSPSQYKLSNNHSLALSSFTMNNNGQQASQAGDEVAFVCHSAFKVKVKPRQTLASVNVKLQELQTQATGGNSSARVVEPVKQPTLVVSNNKNLKRASLRAKQSAKQPAIKPVEVAGPIESEEKSMVQSTFITEETQPLALPPASIETSSVNNEVLEASVNHNLYNFGFRPSTVKKIKPTSSKLESQTSVNNTTSSGLLSSNAKSAGIRNNRVRTATTIASVNTAYTDVSVGNNKQLVRLETDNNDDELRDSSELSFNNLEYREKSQRQIASELFNQVYSDVLNRSVSRPPPPPRTAMVTSSLRSHTPGSDYNVYLQDQQQQFDRTSVVLNNMNEKEFLNLLQEYRKNKSIDLSIVEKVKEESYKPSKSAKSVGEAEPPAINENNSSLFASYKILPVDLNESSDIKHPSSAYFKQKLSPKTDVKRQYQSKSSKDRKETRKKETEINPLHANLLNRLNALSNDNRQFMSRRFSDQNKSNSSPRSLDSTTNSDVDNSRYFTSRLLDNAGKFGPGRPRSGQKISSFYLNYLKNRINIRNNQDTRMIVTAPNSQGIESLQRNSSKVVGSAAHIKTLSFPAIAN